MPQDVTILSVLPDPNVWGHDHEHGPFVDYYLTANDGSKDWFCLWRRKPDSDPPTEGQTLFADLNYWKDSKKGNAIYKLKPAQRPDGSPGTPSSNGTRPQGEKPDSEFWAQKDRRVARAGMLQAVIQARPPHGLDPDEEYIAGINRLTDRLLTSLDERVPHPSSSTQIHTPSSPGENGGAGQSASPDGSAARLTAIASNLDDKHVRLALIAAGAVDVTDIPKAITALDPDQAKTFESNLEDVGHQADQGAEPSLGGTSGAKDDLDGIPFGVCA